MTWLVDTHLLLWAAIGSPRLPSKVRRILEGDPVLFSSASLWEVSIKAGMGRADFDVDVARLRRGLLENGYGEVPITGEHAVLVRSLPRHHADPFDRILIAQAIAEGVTLLTSDPSMTAYDGPIEFVSARRSR